MNKTQHSTVIWWPSPDSPFDLKVLPFVPPKDMELAQAAVTAVVGTGPDGQPQVW